MDHRNGIKLTYQFYRPGLSFAVEVEVNTAALGTATVRLADPEDASNTRAASFEYATLTALRPLLTNYAEGLEVRSGPLVVRRDKSDVHLSINARSVTLSSFQAFEFNRGIQLLLTKAAYHG